MPRVLILKFGAIGDVIMAIPAAHLLHCEGFEVHWVCGETVLPILALYPWIKPILINDASLLKGSPAQKLKVMLQLWHRLAFRSYHLAAILYYDNRYRLLTLPLRATRKLTLSHSDRRFRLLPGRHHTDEFARILLGWPDEHRPLPLPPVRVPPSSLPQSPLSRTEKWRVVLAPAGARNMMNDDALRRWQPENYVELARLLLERQVEVVLIGGPGDAWVKPLFKPCGSMDFTDLIGELSLPQTLALLDDADLLVTHDTGPLHMAGITSCGIVGIFGPTDPQGRLPQRPGTIALWGGEGFACRPCYDGHSFPPCPANDCMAQITPSFAMVNIMHLLSERRDGRLRPPRIIAPPSSIAAAPLVTVAEAHYQSMGADLQTMPHKALFLDRDGVINLEVGYLYRSKDVRFVDGIFSLCRTARMLSYKLVVVTNQSGIARGLYTSADYESLMAWMQEQFANAGARLDAVYHCPYHPVHGVGEWKREHEDRKPSPGMLLRAARDLALNLSESVLIGDRCSDIAAAKAADLRQAFLLSGTEIKGCAGEYLRIDSLADAEAWLLTH